MWKKQFLSNSGLIKDFTYNFLSKKFQQIEKYIMKGGMPIYYEIRKKY